jgi:hypothetical protein
MLEVARRHPRSLEELRKVPGVSDLLVRKLGGILVPSPDKP